MPPNPSAKALKGRHVIAMLAVILLTILAGLYASLPLVWKHYERLKRLDGRKMVTRTGQGIAGDPINVGFEADEDSLLCAFHAAGWRAASQVTLKSSLKIVRSVVERRPYPTAPVSPLYYDKRIEDLAFQLPSGNSAAHRHHVRLWKVLDHGDTGKPVWLGSASYDKSVGVSHYTLRVTHHVSPDMDGERDFLMSQIAPVGKASALFEISGVGPTALGRNGGGDPYFTDGEVKVAVLAAGCSPGLAPKLEAADLPPHIGLKNQIFELIRPLLRKLSHQAGPGKGSEE